jgi:acetylornithine/succinyldiaminopimelate/putrescine aminotransferase
MVINQFTSGVVEGFTAPLAYHITPELTLAKALGLGVGVGALVAGTVWAGRKLYQGLFGGGSHSRAAH